ncbi:hypothetical protein CWI39_2488p0010 [Hamiltosporidium magnivora]|uniref:Uncharacterized protein n=1 Tax=Hamiltosporidium magnivora TaxID=148818 RepID=A0A4Q9KW48_9MICR|nr:hypothetical protein CWI39_2488p0010 [Hamiltosporidium magnivora]
MDRNINHIWDLRNSGFLYNLILDTFSKIEQTVRYYVCIAALAQKKYKYNMKEIYTSEKGIWISFILLLRKFRSCVILLLLSILM